MMKITAPTPASHGEGHDENESAKLLFIITNPHTNN